MAMTPEDALAILNPRQRQPLSTRLDAASVIERAVRECIDSGRGLNVDAEVLPLLTALVPALLSSVDDPLIDSLVLVIEALLASSAPRASAHILSVAEAELEDHGRDLHSSSDFNNLALILQIALNPAHPSNVVAAANALTERPLLVATILRGIEQTHPETSDCYTHILLRLLHAHGASASSVLARCDVPLTRLLTQLPGYTGALTTATLRQTPSVHLLELLAEIATDDALAPTLCAPQVLDTLRPPLLSGLPTLQLASVDMLAVLAEAGTYAAEALCDADLVTFLIEVARGDACADAAHDTARASAIDLRRAVRRLLGVLLHHPLPNAGPICTLLIDALQCRPRSCASTDMDETVVLATLEAGCVCACLTWHTPSTPREMARLAHFCDATLQTLIASPDDAAHTAPLAEPLKAAAALLRATAHACAGDADSAECLMNQLGSIGVSRVLLAGVPGEEVDACVHVELAAALTAVLVAPSLRPPLKRAFAVRMSLAVLRLTQHMCIGATAGDASLVDSEASHLALALLSALGRLPPAWREVAVAASALSVPSSLTACIAELLNSAGAAGIEAISQHGSTALERRLPHVEWLLLHVQHSRLIRPGGSNSDGDDDGAVLTSDDEVGLCLGALAQYVRTRSVGLSASLPPSTLRRLATVWAHHAEWPASMDVDDDHGTETQPPESLAASTLHVSSASAPSSALMHASGLALAQTLVQLPPATTVGLPPIAIRWLLAHADPSQVGPMVLQWAIMVFGEGGEGGCKAPLVEACDGSSVVAPLLVRLLTSSLPLVHARPGGLVAILTLSHACAIRNSGNALAAAGLMSALGQLCMVLPARASEAAQTNGDIDKSSGLGDLRLVLRLMSATIRQTTSVLPSMDADTISATRHAIAAALRHEHTLGGASSTVQLELLNFLNVALTLHAEAFDPVVENEPLMAVIARLASDGRLGPAARRHEDHADDNVSMVGDVHPAAALLLIHLLRSSSTQTASLVELLRGRIRLSDLMAGAHNRCGLRCAAALHLAAEACEADLLSPPCAKPPTQCDSRTPLGDSSPSLNSLLASSPIVGISSSPILKVSAGGAVRADGAALEETSSHGADAEGWSTWVLSGLLNACTRREEAVGVALHRLALCLSSATEGTHAALAFERLANHPWHAFTLEMTAMQRGRLPAGLCAYWSLVLARRPNWVIETATRKPALIHELLAKLLHAPRFGEAELALLTALHALPNAINEQLRNQALELLRFRVREPSAARFANAATDGAEDEPLVGWCTADEDPHTSVFGTATGVVVPLALLRATTAGDTAERAGVMDCLRRAERLLACDEEVMT